MDMSYFEWTEQILVRGTWRRELQEELAVRTVKSPLSQLRKWAQAGVNLVLSVELWRGKCSPARMHGACCMRPRFQASRLLLTSDKPRLFQEIADNPQRVFDLAVAETKAVISILLQH